MLHHHQTSDLIFCYSVTAPKADFFFCYSTKKCTQSGQKWLQMTQKCVQKSKKKISAWRPNTTVVNLLQFSTSNIIKEGANVHIWVPTYTFGCLMVTDIISSTQGHPVCMPTSFSSGRSQAMLSSSIGRPTLLFCSYICSV